MIDRILVPLDGSKAAEVALKVVEQIPSRRIQLLGVEPDCTDLSELCTGARDRTAYLEGVATALREQGHHVSTMVTFGNPAEQIIGMANAADLVVMSSHGRGAMGRVLFGSVADSVVRHAPKPTLIVRGEDWHATALRRIVVPLDGSPLAEQSLPPAIELAKAMRIPVHLVRVVDFDQVQASILAGLEAAEACARQQAALAREARAYLLQHAHEHQTPDCLLTSEVRIGNPVEELLVAIKPEDLTVLSTHGRGGIARWLMGSVAEEIVRRSAGPVLLLRATTNEQYARTGEITGSAGGAS